MYNKSQTKRYGWVKKSYVCNIFKNDISVICVTNIARGKNVWHKNIIGEPGGPGSTPAHTSRNRLSKMILIATEMFRCY